MSEEKLQSKSVNELVDEEAHKRFWSKAKAGVTEWEGEKSFRIIIEQIDDKDFRYNTVGDWSYDEDENEITFYILVPKFKGFKNYAAWLIAIHEMIELFLCDQFGVTQEDVDKHDMMFEHMRSLLPEGDPRREEEPGDDLNAPYYEEHQVADAIEKLVCNSIGMSWKDYGDDIEVKFDEIVKAREENKPVPEKTE